MHSLLRSGEQKGPYPLNTGNLCCDCWYLLLITEMQTKRKAAIIPPSSSTPSCCKPVFLWLKWLSGNLKGQPLFLFFSISLFKSQTLKTKTLKKQLSIQENLENKCRAQGKAQKRPEKILFILQADCLHRESWQQWKPKVMNKNNNKMQQILRKGENLISRITILLDSRIKNHKPCKETKKYGLFKEK